MSLLEHRQSSSIGSLENAVALYPNRGGINDTSTKYNVTNNITTRQVTKFSSIKNDSIKQLTSINFLYTNATSLSNKWSEFNSRIYYLNMPHVVMITETWFNSKSLTNLSNYNSFIKSRSTIRGEGVAIYVRKDLLSYEISIEELIVSI